MITFFKPSYTYFSKLPTSGSDMCVPLLAILRTIEDRPIEREIYWKTSSRCELLSNTGPMLTGDNLDKIYKNLKTYSSI